MRKLFEGVFEENSRIYTKNLAPGKKVYGERLVEENGTEYREWNPFRSKLAAAIKKGLKEMPIKEGFKVLYLGSSEGTTVSHVSDIVGEKGLVIGVDFSAAVMRKFLLICGERKNIVPLLADANKPETYKEQLKGIKFDFLFQDVSQKNQAEIFAKNAEFFLGKGKKAMIAIKARSIAVEKNPKEVFRQEIEKMGKEFKAGQLIELKPFEKDHLLAVCEKM